MIYAFRGADPFNLFNKINQYKYKTFILGQNYRSTKTIVNASQSLIRYNDRPDEKTLFTDNEKGEKILYFNPVNQAEEASRICQIIESGVKSGQMMYSDVAILYRNSFLSRNMEDALMRSKIPYNIVSGTNFYTRKEIKDIISFLDFFMNPRNLLSLNRIINIPKSGIGEKTTDMIIKNACEISQNYAILKLTEMISILEEVSLSSAKLKEKMAPFISRCKEINEYMKEVSYSPSNLIQKIINVFEYQKYLNDYDEDTYEERMMNVGELQSVANTYDDIYEFLENVHSFYDNEGSEGDDEVSENRVRLMTMHASKGLEFRVVFIVPSWRCESERDIQEERRLFYVGMTRAKENLVIMSPKKMMKRGGLVESSPSMFIGQIASEYIHTAKNAS